MEPVTLVLRSKRQKRAAAVQKLQHLVPAVILLGDGWSALTRHAAGVEFAIALFEVVSGALFVFAAMRGIRGAVRGASRAHPHPHAHHGIDWTDVFAAAVVLAETIEHYHRTGHIVRPNVLMIATLLIMAVSHGRIMGFAERRRALRISDDGIRSADVRSAGSLMRGGTRSARLPSPSDLRRLRQPTADRNASTCRTSRTEATCGRR